MVFWGHERHLARRPVALLAVTFGLGAWMALGVAGHDAGPAPEKHTWGLVRSSMGEHASFRERTRPRTTQPSLSSPCAQGKGDAGGCVNTTRIPEPITLLAFGAMLAGLGVVVRRGLRGRAGTSA